MKDFEFMWALHKIWHLYYCRERTVKKKKLKDDCIDSNILVRDCNSYPEQQNVEYRKKISSDLK